MSTPSNLYFSANADCETHLALLSDFHARTFEGVQRLIDSNLAEAQMSLEHMNAVIRQLLDHRASLQLPALDSLGTTAALERQMLMVVDHLHAEFVQCAQERITEANARLMELIALALKTAPDEATAMRAFLLQTAENANLGYQQFLQAIKRREA